MSGVLGRGFCQRILQRCDNSPVTALVGALATPSGQDSAALCTICDVVEAQAVSVLPWVEMTVVTGLEGSAPKRTVGVELRVATLTAPEYGSSYKYVPVRCCWAAGWPARWAHV